MKTIDIVKIFCILLGFMLLVIEPSFFDTIILTGCLALIALGITILSSFTR